MRDEKGKFIKGHSFTTEMLEKMSNAKKGIVAWGIPKKYRKEDSF